MQRTALVLFCMALPCLAASFPDYPVKPASEYPNIVVKSNLAVAAVPIDDTLDQYKYFGMDLKSKGFLAVFLVMENRASNDSFLLQKEALMYGPAGRSGSNLANPAKPSTADKALSVATYVPYYGIMAHLMASKSQRLKQNLLEKELQSVTVSPSVSVHGFIFVPAHWKHSSRDKIQLGIPFVRSGSDDRITIDLEF